MESNIFNKPIYSGTHGNAKTEIAKVTSAIGVLDQLIQVQAGTTIVSTAAFGAAGTVGYLDGVTSSAAGLDGAFEPYTFAEDGEVTYTPSADGAATVVINYV